MDNESVDQVPGEASGQFVDQVSGENIQFNSGCAKEVSAQGDLSMSRSLALNVRAGNDMEVGRSYSTALVAGGNAQLSQSGAGVIVVGGDTEINTGGAQLIVAGGDMTVTQGFVGAVFGNKVTLAEGGKVLLDMPQAIAFGAALGAAFGLVSWLLRGSGRRRG